MPAIANIAVRLTPDGVAVFEESPEVYIGYTRDYYASYLSQWDDPDTLPGMAWLEEVTAGFFGSLGTAESISYEPGAEPGMSIELGTLTLIGLEVEPPGPPTTVSITVRITETGLGTPADIEASLREIFGQRLAGRKPSFGLPDAAWFQVIITNTLGPALVVEEVTYPPDAVDGMSPTLDGVTLIEPDASPVPVNVFYRFTDLARDTQTNRGLVQGHIEQALLAYTDPEAPPNSFYQKALDQAGLWWAEITAAVPTVEGTYGRAFVLGQIAVTPPEGPIVAEYESAAYGFVVFVGPWLLSQLPHGWDSNITQPRGLWDPDGIDVRAPDGSRLVFVAGNATRGEGNPPTAQRSTGVGVAVESVAKVNGTSMPHRQQLSDPVFPLPNRVNGLGQHNYPLWVPDFAFARLQRETPGHWPNRPAMNAMLTFTVPEVVQQRYPNIPPIDPSCRIVVMGGDYTQSPYYFIRTYTQEEQNQGFKNIVGMDFEVTERRWRDGTVTSIPEEPPVGQMVALPSVQLEKLTTDADEPVHPRLGNRIPEDNEVEVPHQTRGVQTPIVFQLLGAYNFTPYASTTQVLVDGETVFAQGAYENGWQGSVASLGADGIRVSLTPPAPFPSSHRTLVTVHHNDQYVGSWHFTWKDETPPVVLDAASEGLFIVRVTFNEAVSHGTALVAENYRLRRVSPLSMVPKAVMVVPGASPREVWVMFEQALTFGATYALGVSGVTDLYGNQVVDDEAEERTFVAARPEVPDGRRFLLWDFIPDLYKRIDRERGDLERFVSVLQEPTDVLLHEIDRFARVVDPDVAPEDFVDAMLADLGCPFDVGALDLGEKRKLLSLLISIYQQKGTTEGLIDAARALLGLEIDVHPLNEGGWTLGVHELGNYETTWLGPETSFQRFAFEVSVFMEIGRELSDEERARLIELIHVMRPAHTHFRRLNEMTNGYYPEA